MPTDVINHNEEPIISIGLPVFNSEKTISHAIQAIIDQSIKNWELTVSYTHLTLPTN